MGFFAAEAPGLLLEQGYGSGFAAFFCYLVKYARGISDSNFWCGSGSGVVDVGPCRVYRCLQI